MAKTVDDLNSKLTKRKGASKGAKGVIVTRLQPYQCLPADVQEPTQRTAERSRGEARRAQTGMFPSFNVMPGRPEGVQGRIQGCECRD